MEDVEERRRRFAAMRKQTHAQTTDDGTVSSIPSLSASRLSNPLECSSADTAAAPEVKKPGVGPSQAPLSRNNESRHTSAGLLPPPPHLQAARVHPDSGRSRWQPNVSQRPYSNPGFAPSQPDSDWPPLGHQKPDAKPVFCHPQPPPQFQPQYVPHHVNQWSNQNVGRGRGRKGDTGFGGRQSRNSPSGDSSRDGETSEGRGAHGRGQGGVRIVSAKEQPGVFVTKKMLETMLEDPWRALEINRMEKV